jgi:cbb3-type cytochrome oxidase maturation protein
MSAVIVLILASLVVATGFLLAFLWAVKSGQFEDKVTPSMRILWDDKKKKNNDEKNNDTNQGVNT